MTAVACQAKSQKNHKSCFRNLIKCCCSRGSQKKTEVETVEIYQRPKNPFESNLSLLTQSSCEGHAFLKPKTFNSTTSQTDRSYPVVSSGDAVVNYCQTTGSNTEPKSNIKMVECISLTDEMIRKDNEELVETILAKYLEYKHQESLIKQQIMEEMPPPTAVAYFHHEEQESHLQNFHVAIDSNSPAPSDGEFQEKANVASSSDSVELPVKSKSEPAHCEHCMLHSPALGLKEISKSDSYIMLNAENENNKLELVFLPSSSTESCAAGEAVNQLESSKSIQYKISCSDHEKSYTVGCVKENGNISNICDGKESKATTKSDDCDVQHLGTPSGVKWKLSIASHPEDHLPSDS